VTGPAISSQQAECSNHLRIAQKAPGAGREDGVVCTNVLNFFMFVCLLIAEM